MEVVQQRKSTHIVVYSMPTYVARQQRRGQALEFVLMARNNHLTVICATPVFFLFKAG